jgi:hypothetical protein
MPGLWGLRGPLPIGGDQPDWLQRRAAKRLATGDFVIAADDLIGVCADFPGKQIHLTQVIAEFGLREARLPDFFAAVQLRAEVNIKAGDLIKLDSGEEGSITKVGWTSTQLQSSEGNFILMQSSWFIRSAARR